MKTKEILKGLVKECREKLNLSAIVQFGSSVYSKKFNDVDLILLFNEDIVSVKNILNLIKIIKLFEKKNKNLVFDFGGVGDRKRKGNLSITIIPLGKKDLNVVYNPHDLFFYKNLVREEKIILFGKNPFLKDEFNLTNQHLFEILSVEQKHTLRKSLGKEKSKYDSLYFLFKTFLRAMLVNQGNFQKKDLIKKFNIQFKNKIKLPKNSEKIINKKLTVEDFEDILNFTNDCLNYLIK
ncbi:hypothetical protein GW932_04465 [archaeon]|nr:hypothetical protein [archaeon]